VDITEVTADDTAESEPLFQQDLVDTPKLAKSAEPGGTREAGVRVHQPTVYRLSPGDFSELRRRPDFHRWLFQLVHFRFDLEKVPPRHEYISASFSVAFDRDDARFMEVHPVLVTTSVDVEKASTFTIGPDLTFEGLGGGSLGNATVERRFRYTRLEPVITAFGAGSPAVRWEFSPSSGAELTPHARATFAVLQLPRDVEELALAFNTEATISRPRLGVLHSVLAESDTSVAVFRPREGTFTAASE
jgi:hypothetical protein